MKKFLLIIFLFFCCINVNALERRFVASEYLTGVSYMKYDGHTYYYKNAQVIRDSETNELAFCVEPFGSLIDNTSYSSSDYGRYGISDEAWDKINLYAYYGYGYRGHTNTRWISITQIMIWRTLYPNYQFEWIDSVETKNIIDPFSTEVRELNNLVNTHYKLPKLNSSYNIDVNGSLKLSDTNAVLRFYDIVSSDFEVERNISTITIKAGNEEKSGTIHFRRAGNIYNATPTFFYSSTSQNILKRGDITPIDFEINVNVISGKIIVNKVDNDGDSNSTAMLDGAVFELFDSDMNLIKEGTIEDHQLFFDNLSYGTYYIKEKTPGEGYYLNNDTYEIIIDANNIEKEITIGNDIIKSKVTITKYYGSKEDFENNKMKKEKDVSFDIFDENNNLVFSGITDQDGIISVVLPYGKYVLKQRNTTEGYNSAADYYFEINDESNHAIDIVLYDFKIEVPNANISFLDYVLHLLGFYFD